MSKRISDLNEAKASRARSTAQRHQPDPQRPRLADRLVALAPLAQAPLTPASDADEETGLSRLADTHRFRPQSAATGSAPERNALILRRTSSLPQAQEPVRLSRVGDLPLRPLDLDDDRSLRDGPSVGGFLVGLSAATAIGFALYIYLA